MYEMFSSFVFKIVISDVVLYLSINFLMQNFCVKLKIEW